MSSLKKKKLKSVSKSKCNTITLKNLLENGRTIKKISQRELARRIGISNTSVNDLERGKIKKPSVDMLVNISEELDISINELLKASGYEKLLFLLNNDKSKINNE